MRNNIVNFVLTIDQKYVQQSIVTMTSILCNLNKKCWANFFIFFKGYKTKPVGYKKLEKKFNCTINCINTEKFDILFSKCMESTFENYWISIAAYYRLLMFKVLPNNVKHAFYVDADIIVDKDLWPLYKDFVKNNKFFASVVDIYLLKLWLRNKKYYSNYKEFNKMIKNRLKFSYFCDGFYLANIKQAKDEHIFEQLIDFLTKHPNMKQADQDVMNAIFSQKYSNLMTYLDLKYDVFMDAKSSSYKRNKKYFYSKQEIKNAFETPFVLHYAGPNKPWINNKCKQGAYKWWFYCDKSPAKFDRIDLTKKE